MGLNISTPESLGRLACFAAIELNHLGNDEKTTLENIISFSDFLDGNFSLSSSATAYLIEPMSAYAVTSVFYDPGQSAQSMEEIFSKIDSELITPLKEIALMDEESLHSTTNRARFVHLASRCLAISVACTSMNTEYEDSDNELYW